MTKNKWFLNGSRGSGRTIRLLCETYENRIADLEKENAELKSENQKWKDEWQEQVQKATDEGYARTLQTIQLSKAKDIIKNLMVYVPVDLKEYEEAKQFLSEVEK